MDENPYEAPHVPASRKRRFLVGPSTHYALLAFPIAWLALPTLWLINVIQDGTFMGVGAELTLVLLFSAIWGTVVGAALWAFLVVVLRTIRRWNERRQQWPE